MTDPLFDIECAVAAGIITWQEIANAPIIDMTGED